MFLVDLSEIWTRCESCHGRTLFLAYHLIHLSADPPSPTLMFALDIFTSLLDPWRHLCFLLDVNTIEFRDLFF